MMFNYRSCFFFSSRRRHTRWPRDWSSDVCSSDLKVISKHTKSIINQMIKEPIIQAKEMAGKENSEELLALFIDIFGIDDQIKDDVVYRIKRTQNMTSLNEPSRPYYLKEHSQL